MKCYLDAWIIWKEKADFTDPILEYLSKMWIDMTYDQRLELDRRAEKIIRSSLQE
jgi:hypothetical protein